MQARAGREWQRWKKRDSFLTWYFDVYIQVRAMAWLCNGCVTSFCFRPVSKHLKNTRIWNNKTTFCDMLVITRWRRKLSSNATQPALPTVFAAFIITCHVIFVGIIPLPCVCLYWVCAYIRQIMSCCSLCTVLFLLCHWTIRAKCFIYI